MPQLDPLVVTFLAAIAASLTQLLKGLFLSEVAKRWLPIIVLVLCTAAGAGLALGYSRDVLAGIFEGLIAGLSSLGVYATGKSVAPTLVNTEGWIRRKGQS